MCFILLYQNKRKMQFSNKIFFLNKLTSLLLTLVLVNTPTTQKRPATTVFPTTWINMVERRVNQSVQTNRISKTIYQKILSINYKLHHNSVQRQTDDQQNAVVDLPKTVVPCIMANCNSVLSDCRHRIQHVLGKTLQPHRDSTTRQPLYSVHTSLSVCNLHVIVQNI